MGSVSLKFHRVKSAWQGCLAGLTEPTPLLGYEIQYFNNQPTNHRALNGPKRASMELRVVHAFPTLRGEGTSILLTSIDFAE
jgi:hypothetical protein